MKLSHLVAVALLLLAAAPPSLSGFVDYEEATPLVPYAGDEVMVEIAGEARLQDGRVACGPGACPLANGQCCPQSNSCCPSTSKCWVHPVLVKTVCPKVTVVKATRMVQATAPAPVMQGPSAIAVPQKDPDEAAMALERRLEGKFKTVFHTQSQLKNYAKNQPMIDTAVEVAFQPSKVESPILKELRSLTGSRCEDTLGGFMIKDRFPGQPRINMGKVYGAIDQLSKLPDMQFEVVGKEDGYKIELLHLLSHHSEAKKIMITSGVHGNEPVGVSAQLEIIAILYNSPWRRYFDFTFVPTLNPGGLRDNFRTMRDGRDLNRLFKSKTFPKAMAVLKKYVSANKYVMSLDLHGAMKRHGFFVIKGGPDRGLVKKALQSLDSKLLLPSDSGYYPGYVGLNGDPRKYLLKNAGEATSNNPGTMKGFMFELGCPDAYTVEYPGQLPVCTRQSGLVTLVTSIIGHYIEMEKPAAL